jgi:RNA 3'-terminal phosphate cyclase
MAAPAAAGQGIVLAAADDLGFVDLDEPGKRAAVAGHHAASQFGTQQPGRFVRAQAELAL